jgi:hypothetical protein
VYALDPRGATPFAFDVVDGGAAVGMVSPVADQRELRMSQDALRLLAEETHGRAITNVNALEEGLAQMVRESSAYYLLGYATEAPADGRFHRITVRVRRDGVDVRARRASGPSTGRRPRASRRIRRPCRLQSRRRSHPWRPGSRGPLRGDLGGDAAG